MQSVGGAWGANAREQRSRRGRCVGRLSFPGSLLSALSPDARCIRSRASSRLPSQPGQRHAGAPDAPTRLTPSPAAHPPPPSPRLPAHAWRDAAAARPGPNVMGEGSRSPGRLAAARLAHAPHAAARAGGAFAGTPSRPSLAPASRRSTATEQRPAQRERKRARRAD